MKKALLLFIPLIAIFFSTNAQEVQDTSDILKPGDMMPDFTVTQMDGSAFSSAGLQGKTVLINFFATWCPPCRRELPVMQSVIYDKYKDRDDFVILIISREEAPEKVIPFVKEKAYPMDFYSDIDRSCYAQFAHKFIPRNYVFDTSGKLVYASRGFNKEEFDQMVEKIESLLAE